MTAILTTLSPEEEAHNVRSNCDMCGKEIFLKRVSNSYINNKGERVFVMDVTDRNGRCLLCRMEVIDAKRIARKIATIGE